MRQGTEQAGEKQEGNVSEIEILDKDSKRRNGFSSKSGERS